MNWGDIMQLRTEEIFAILSKRGGGGGSGGTTNYNHLTNKPIINGVTITGNLTLEQLGIEEMSNTRIDQIIQSIGGL